MMFKKKGKKFEKDIQKKRKTGPKQIRKIGFRPRDEPRNVGKGWEKMD